MKNLIFSHSVHYWQVIPSTQRWWETETIKMPVMCDFAHIPPPPIPEAPKSVGWNWGHSEIRARSVKVSSCPPNTSVPHFCPKTIRDRRKK